MGHLGFCTVLPSPYLLSWDIFGPGEICSQPPHSGDYVFKKGRVRATRISFRQPSEGKSGLSLGRKKKGLALVLPPFLSLLCSSLLRPSLEIQFTWPEGSRAQGFPQQPCPLILSLLQLPSTHSGGLLGKLLE